MSFSGGVDARFVNAGSGAMLTGLPVEVFTFRFAAVSWYCGAHAGSVVAAVSLAPTAASQRTGRKSNCAVSPTTLRTARAFFTPGTLTTTSFPCRLTVAPETPRQSTRLGRIVTTYCRSAVVACVVGLYTTDSPPARSRPNLGPQPSDSVAASDPKAMATVRTRLTIKDRRDPTCGGITSRHLPSGDRRRIRGRRDCTYVLSPRGRSPVRRRRPCAA